jgi:hypothetical protein
MVSNKSVPFHKSIALFIENEPGGPTNGRVRLLMAVIRMSDIPAGHDKLISAIYKYFDFPGGGKWAQDIRVTIEHIEAERTRHAKPSTEDFPSISHDADDLDELENQLSRTTCAEKSVGHPGNQLEGVKSFNQR